MPLAEENDVIPKRVLGIRIHQHAVRETVLGRENLTITRRDDPGSERVEIARLARKHDRCPEPKRVLLHDVQRVPLV